MKHEKPVEDKDINVGCLNCSSVTKILKMSKVLAVGFGDVSVSRDGEVLYSEQGVKNDEYATTQNAEDMALEDPDHYWRILFYAPLHEEEYQRQGNEKWVLIRSGLGFA